MSEPLLGKETWCLLEKNPKGVDKAWSFEFLRRCTKNGQNSVIDVKSSREAKEMVS